jgi:hypothetical protein
MKAIDLVKKLYPGLSKNDFIQQTCPDNLLIVEKINCSKDKNMICQECIDCWNQEVSSARADWLITSKQLSDLMCK